VSAVTAANCHQAAAAVAPGLSPGAWFFDLNSASPGHKQQAARAVEQAGGRYVEAALMSPIASRRLASPFLLGGPHAAEFAQAAGAWGLSDLTVYSQEVGRAAASKLCRSVIVKGLESLLTESLLAAREYGVEKEVLDSLSNILPEADWQAVATYFVSRSLRHGQRRSEEMIEAAATVEEAGVEPLMSLAAAKRQLWAAGHADALAEPELAAIIDHIRRSQAAATAGRLSQGTPL
jgi:3-hydroxyisobutyrate dehydrogenase-like beta-hydroxyacid dehydrogenase